MKEKPEGVYAYLEALKKFENSIYCNECGNSHSSNFIYWATYASGELWICKVCRNEVYTGNKPNEDHYTILKQLQ